MATFNFNTTYQDIQGTQGGFEPLPAGEYTVIGYDSEIKDTKNKTGQYIQVIFEVLDGAKKGAKLFERFNVVNGNPKAVEIAQKQLSSLCSAIGLEAFNDTDELLNKPVIAVVGIDEGKNGYGPSNKIKFYKNPTAKNIPSSTPPAQVSVQSGKTTPAWKR